jgi:hypothetical protein
MSHHKVPQTSVARCMNTQTRSYSTKPTSSAFAKVNLRTLLSLLVLLVTWTSLFGTATAQDTLQGRQRRSASPFVVPVEEDIAVRRGSSLLVVDSRPRPVVPFMHLQRRQDAKPSSTKTKTPATTKASLHTDPSGTPTDFAIPQPFDTALSNNFTTNCAVYFSHLLTNNDFKQCRPFSLLLQVRLTYLIAQIVLTDSSRHQAAFSMHQSHLSELRKPSRRRAG